MSLGLCQGRVGGWYKCCERAAWPSNKVRDQREKYRERICLDNEPDQVADIVNGWSHGGRLMAGPLGQLQNEIHPVALGTYLQNNNMPDLTDRS